MFWTPAFAGVTPQGTFYEIIKYDGSVESFEGEGDDLSDRSRITEEHD